MICIIRTKFLYFVTFSFIFFGLSACQHKTNNIVETPLQEIVEIAVLMPLTGTDAVLGQQYNKLVKLGLEDGLKGAKINVTSYDAADERQVLAALPKIIARKTKIILGPLYSPITSLIADKASEHDLIIITMSNNPSLASEKLFVFGHAPLKQLDRMVNYLLDHKERHFIALLPAGEHAKNISKIMQDMVVRRNAVLLHTEFYSNTPEAINKAVKSVADIVDKFNEMDDVADRVAIYLSDDYRNLNMVFDSIKKYNLDKKAIIVGDNRIDTDYATDLDITFTGSLYVLNTDMIEKAKDLGVAHISFMHAVAYDLGKMTAHYMDDQFVANRFINRMNTATPYTGISGNIYFIDSIAQRGYDIIKREDSVYSTVESWQHEEVK